MPCGTDRSDPVQILKITPVFPGAITEKELIRLTRTTTTTRPVRTLLATLAKYSGESRTVFMGVRVYTQITIDVCYRGQHAHGMWPKMARLSWRPPLCRSNNY